MADSDVPPLEDMSDLLQHMGVLRENMDVSSRNQNPLYVSSTDSNILHSKPLPDNKRAEERSTERNVHKPSGTEICKAKTDTRQTSSSTASSGMFGGLKKGFLFGDTKNKAGKDIANTRHDSGKSAKETCEEENIPYIKPNTKEDDSKFRFSEVQQAMEASQQFLEKKDWVTDDLLTQIQQNETLSKRLTDPRFVQAIGEFQKDPKAASQKYQNNPEMQKFFTDFCNLMGDHFSNLAESSVGQNATSGPTVTDISVHDPAGLSSEEDEKVQDILADPELREILVDPEIQSLFEMLRTRPEQASRYIRSVNNEMRQKIGKLVEAGLLQLQV